MPWLLLGTAALGAVQAAEQRKRDNEWNRAQAEVSRYSPWTGISGNLKQSNASVLGGALRGGLTGAMMGQAFGGGGGGAEAVSNGDVAAKAGEGALGSGEMSSAFSKMGESANGIGQNMPTTQVASFQQPQLGSQYASRGFGGYSFGR